MTTSCAQNGSIVGFVAAVAVGLSLASVAHLHGSAVEAGAVQDRPQSSESEDKAAARPGVCEREAEKLVGQKAVRISRSVRAPKKLRNVPPDYPDLPPGSAGSGVWLGEVLIDNAGKVAHVWPIRELKFVPPFPAFNQALADAVRKWEFEPLLVEGKPTAFCMTVTFNIDWQ